MSTKTVEEIHRVVIRFAGDSGDGMQLTGERFTNATAAFGNDLATLPDFPAEIRAPAGTIGGVSAFQIHFADNDILTPGDRPDVLVAMNPAAMKKNIMDLPAGATLIINEDAFTANAAKKAGYDSDPLEDERLEGFNVFRVKMTTMTLEATKDVEGTSKKERERAKNLFALGLISWMYSRPDTTTLEWLEKKFANKPEILEANVRAFKAGFNFGETAELFAHKYEVRPAIYEPGVYRNITGNVATAWGLVAAAKLANISLFYAGYPITPASDILHELSKHKNFGVRTVQAEDEIAAAGAAVGAAFGGHLAATATSGPGIDLKSETLGLAMMLEIPMLIVDVQRGGPSTGLPTKQEQADLMLAMYGRHGEAPMPIIAPISPSDCFLATIEAARLAITYRTPVMILTDTYLANSSEPWKLPAVDELPKIDAAQLTKAVEGEEFLPYSRDDKLARPWAIPGTKGLEHRVGGLEKQDGTGNVSYDSANHDYMSRIRAAKIARIAEDIPEVEVDDPNGDAEVLVIGWGSTFGSIRAGCRRVRNGGKSVAHVQLRHVNPLPRNLGEVLRRYDRILVPELNLGQLSRILRAEYLVDAKSYTKMQGSPFRAAEIETEILKRV